MDQEKVSPVVLKEWEKSELKKSEHLENTNLKKLRWTNPKPGCETETVTWQSFLRISSAPQLCFIFVPLSQQNTTCIVFVSLLQRCSEYYQASKMLCVCTGWVGRMCSLARMVEWRSLGALSKVCVCIRSHPVMEFFQGPWTCPQFSAFLPGEIPTHKLVPC